MQTPVISALPLFIEGRQRAYTFVRETHEDWEIWKLDPHVKSLAAFRVALSISMMDLYDATITTLLTITPELTSNKELDFVSKASCRMLALRVFEQRDALFRFRQLVEKMVKHEETKIDYSTFDQACSLNREPLKYVLKLKDIRNATGHYDNDHAHIISLVEDIEPVKVVESSSALLRCYAAFSNVLNQVVAIKMPFAK